MALHTVLAFIVLCIGVLWTRPNRELMRIIMSDCCCALLTRRLLIAAITVPFVLGRLILQGYEAQKYDTAFAILLFSIVQILIFAVLVWRSAPVIESFSHQRDCARMAIKAYEDQLRSFVDSNVIGILFGDVYGSIQQANDKFLGMIGYTREDLLAGKLSWRNITPPEYAYLDDQGVKEAKTSPNGACTPYEKEYIRQDGSRIPVLVGYVLMGEQREESVAFILDLSERRQAQEKILQLNKNLERRIVELQTLLEVIPIGIGIAEDPQCQTIKVNSSLAKQLGISPEINASLSAPNGEQPKTFKIYRQGKELLPDELPMQYSAANGVEVLDYEIDVVHEDGKLVKLLEYVTPLFDEEGKTRGCIGAFLDVTIRKQAEELEQNQQKWLKDVLDLMPIPLLFIESGTARVTFANLAADELAGGEFPKNIPAEEYHTAYYCTDAAGDHIPNDQMPGVRVARGECLDGFEMDWHTCTGIRSLLVFADTMPAMHGHPATCVMVFQDVSNLKQIEKALSLGNKRLQLLFNTASDLLSSHEPVALIDSLFHKLAKQIDLDVYLNYLAEGNSQVMHLASWRGIPQELAKEIESLGLGQAICGTAAQERHPYYVENVQESTDPKTELIRSLGIRAYYSCPLIAQGQLLGTLSFGSRSRSAFTENQRGMMQAVCDQIAIAMERASLIASLERQTQQLTETNRMKNEFLGILSHELRSPLNAVLGWAQLLRSRKLSEIQTAKALETIEINARSQTQLIEDLLDVSRMIRGKLLLDVRICNLMPIIESAIETVSLAAQAKEIDVKFSLSPWQEPQDADFLSYVNQKTSEFLELTSTNVFSQITDHINGEFPVSGDRERLQQIIWNLLSNAIKFTPRGGRVEVRLSKIIDNCQNVIGNQCRPLITNHAQIQVIDTGIGISPGFLPYVFDRFRQADSSSTRSYSGLGLGLAIVHHLVELHGGTVHVESQGEKQGATFTVRLPLTLPSNKSVLEPTSKQPENITPLPRFPSLLGVQVLVIDDEADSREFITTILQQYQAEVQSAGSIQEGLRIISQWKPDVLVSDISMSRGDGYSLIRQVRSQPPEQGGKIPAVALTTFARVEDRIRAIQEGYQLYLPKPIEPAELITVVASLVERLT